MKKSKYLTAVIVFAFVFVLLLTVGYSSFGAKFFVKDALVTVRLEKDIRITDVTFNGGTNSGVSSGEDYNVNKVFADITLPNKESTVSYTVKVNNLGFVDMRIKNITLPEELSNILEVYVDPNSYSYGNVITREEKNIDLVIKYKSDAVLPENTTFNNFVLNFEFDELGIRLYSLLSSNSTMDNIKSQYVSSNSGINYKEVSSNNNGKGLYTLSSSASTEYPIRFYRGAVDNNNVVFGRFCWKIVRTTPTGGVKILYNGVASESNTCDTANNTGASSTIGETKYNDLNKAIISAGYYYQDNYEITDINLKTYFSVVDTVAKSSNFYFADSAEYRDNKYYLYNSDGSDLKLISNATYDELVGKYYCDSSADNCSYLGYIENYNGTTVYRNKQFLYNGNLVDSLPREINISSSFEKTNETFNLNEPVKVSIHDYITNYKNYEGMYMCTDFSSSCSEIVGWKSNSARGFWGSISSTNYKFSSSVSYENGKYILNDPVSKWELDSSLNYTHYTCGNNEDTCDTVYYIFGYLGKDYSIIKLKNGENISDALTNMTQKSSNETPSLVAQKVNSWYSDNLTSYNSYLEDTIWCNDRTISNLGGFNPVGGEIETNNSRLYFAPYNRAMVKNMFDFTCPPNDSFTVSKDNGNGALSNPIGLLTVDEMRLAGHSNLAFSANNYLQNGVKYWSMSPSHIINNRDQNILGYNSNSAMAYDDGKATSVYARPSVSLKYDTYINGAGNGTASNPYVIESIE